MMIFTSKERIQSALYLVISTVIGVYFLINNGYEIISATEKSNDIPDLVIEALKHNHSTYLANVWATMGFLLLAIGWNISSEKARELFSNSGASRLTCLNTIVILMVFHGIILFDMVYESERILSNFNMDVPGVNYFVISVNHAISSTIVDSAFFVLLWVLIEQQTPKKTVYNKRLQSDRELPPEK